MRIRDQGFRTPPSVYRRNEWNSERRWRITRTLAPAIAFLFALTITPPSGGAAEYSGMSKKCTQALKRIGVEPVAAKQDRDLGLFFSMPNECSHIVDTHTYVWWRRTARD